MTTEQKQTEQTQEQGEAREDQALFGDDELTRFRGRWDEIQAGFVDEPRKAVTKEDALVADLVERITASLSEARSDLESQWSQGEEASTEDLRVALTRYRAFFKRLLDA